MESRTFTSMLRGLDRSTLEELILRRPEAAELLDGASPAGLEDLARVLSRPHLIVRAVDRLDLFGRQLLAVVVWLGPACTRAELERQTPGVPWRKVERAFAELSRWGLAFPEGAGRAWKAFVPKCVASLFRPPGGLGPHAKEVLGGLTNEALIEMLLALGGTRPQPARKDLILGAVVERLSDPALLDAILAGAPEQAREILAAIRKADQPPTAGSLLAAGFRDLSPNPWSPSFSSFARRRPEDPLEWLQRHGLVAAVTQYDYFGTRFVVPAEVEVTLRGGVIFERWHTEPPSFEPVDVPTAPWQPDAVVGEVQALLDEWALRRPPALQKGGLGVRELKRSAKALGLDERRVPFLYALAAELGLLAVEHIRGSAGDVVVPSDEATAWSRLPTAEQWDGLFRAWLRARLWTDTDEGGLIGPDKARSGVDLPVRTAVVRALASLPAGTGAAAKDVALRIVWEHPTLLHCPECGIVAVERAAEGLAFLGTGTAEPPSLGEPGRTALRTPGWHAGRSKATKLFHDTVATCVVQADLRVIVPGPPDRELGEALIAFADLEASAPARVYRLSDRSIGRALDAGRTGQEIIDVLRSHAPKGVPQNVEYLVADVARRHGNLVAGRAGLYVRGDDPALIAEIAADRRLARLRPRLLAPTVVAVSDKSVDALLKTLRDAGYLPVAERGGEEVEVASTRGPSARGRAPTRWMGDEERDDTPDRRPLLYHVRTGTSEPSARLGPDQAAALAERLSSAPPSSRKFGGGPEHEEPSLPPGHARTRRDITDLLHLAVEERMVVRIGYRSVQGGETVRDIEPLIVMNGAVEAWCRLRTDLRNFPITRIQWAEATGETFEADLPARLEERLELG